MQEKKKELQKKPWLESSEVAVIISPTMVGAIAMPAFWIAVQKPKAVPIVLGSTT